MNVQEMYEYDPADRQRERADERRAKNDREMIEARLKSFRAGIAWYAYWKDGEQFVGSCGKTLKDALAQAEGDYPLAMATFGDWPA